MYSLTVLSEASPAECAHIIAILISEWFFRETRIETTFIKDYVFTARRMYAVQRIGLHIAVPAMARSPPICPSVRLFVRLSLCLSACVNTAEARPAAAVWTV